MQGERSTPWAEWFRFGVRVLGLEPVGFWNLSLWEWLALIDKTESAGPSRAELEALLRAHPDGLKE
jgi:uncharacterized phage protein (TIGR02216 family)